MSEHAHGIPVSAVPPNDGLEVGTTHGREIGRLRARLRRLPRWLLPGLAAGLVVTGLVVAGVLSLSAVLYIGLFGGMLLMHVGRHGGHGGHGGHASRDDDLSHSSPGPQPGRSRSASGLDDRAAGDPNRSETPDHDQRNAHSCH